MKTTVSKKKWKILKELNEKYSTFDKAPGDMCSVCKGKPDTVVYVMVADQNEIDRLCTECKEKAEFSMRSVIKEKDEDTKD